MQAHHFLIFFLFYFNELFLIFENGYPACMLVCDTYIPGALQSESLTFPGTKLKPKVGNIIKNIKLKFITLISFSNS